MKSSAFLVGCERIAQWYNFQTCVTIFWILHIRTMHINIIANMKRGRVAQKQSGQNYNANCPQVMFSTFQLPNSLCLS